ncbi:hypothetical protein DPMN_063496 [Dreissena polymorpha]|uniref:Uncharacterized protein n=1 Tax=Dreissena polymorpha TaxID=45954 RepID=A0A9D4CAM0_DREPO|nr:hypothetical protein DPMN_063496 [Dreissena polymorpha]
MYHSRCHNIIRETSAAITQYNVCDIVCHIYHKALSAENLQVGFRKTGLFLLNKDAIPRESMFPAQVYHSDDTDDSDLTVEGGLQIGPENEHTSTFFETVEQKIRSVKKSKSLETKENG